MVGSQFFARSLGLVGLGALFMMPACGGGDAAASEGSSPSAAAPLVGDAPPATPPDPAAAPSDPAASAEATPADPAAPALAAASAPAPAAPVLPYRGVNLSGGEFGSNIPGTLGVDYRWPTSAEVDYYMSKGATAFRVGFRWERMQATQNGELDATYLGGLDQLVNYATTKGATVIIEPHNFARYNGSTIGSADVPNASFADFWRRLALHYGANPHVMFNLMNEPHDLPTEQWVSAANAAIAAIRATAAPNTLVVPGNAWTGAYTWASTSYGTPNAVAMLNVVDPGNNMLFEVHQYLDSDASGGSSQCISSTIGSERLAPFIAWLRANGKKGFLGEFAGADNPTCTAAVRDMLTAVRGASDVLQGWTWWGAGPAWPANYIFQVEPNGAADAPLMTLLAPFLAAP
jgi:endoglucanase